MKLVGGSPARGIQHHFWHHRAGFSGCHNAFSGARIFGVHACGRHFRDCGGRSGRRAERALGVFTTRFLPKPLVWQVNRRKNIVMVTAAACAGRIGVARLLGLPPAWYRMKRVCRRAGRGFRRHGFRADGGVTTMPVYRILLSDKDRKLILQHVEACVGDHAVMEVARRISTSGDGLQCRLEIFRGEQCIYDGVPSGWPFRPVWPRSQPIPDNAKAEPPEAA